MAGNGYATFKTVEDRQMYCSKKKFKSHAEVKPWISACVSALKIEANDITGIAWPVSSQPDNAIIM